MATETAMTTPEVLSLAARLDQLEAAVLEAHSILDRIASRTEEEAKDPRGEGAMACINRCQDRMAELNKRLADTANRVGSL